MLYMDYTTLEATGKDFEAKLSERIEIAGLWEIYDTDIALLKEAMVDMQQLLKNPERVAMISNQFLIRKHFNGLCKIFFRASEGLFEFL
jgi:hypothetical protein